MDQIRFHYQPGDPHADDNWYSTDGGMLTVSLYGNCTTGYEWVHSISDDSVLTCHTSVFTPFRYSSCSCQCDSGEAVPNSFACGAGGICKKIFSVADDGYCLVMFCYKRPWEQHPVAKKLLMITAKHGTLIATEIGNLTYDPTDPLRNLKPNED